MNAKKLIEKATKMISHCKGRTCQGCVGNEYLEEYGGTMCDISEYSDNRHQIVEQVLKSLNRRKL